MARGSAQPVQLPVAGQLVDRYQLVECVGKGGMAQVFHARMQGIGGFERDVALKVLLPEYASESDFVGMLLDEARIAGAILHPCVVGVLDVGRTGELFYLVMEYVDGFDLRTLLRRLPGGRVKLPTSLYLVAEVLRGLHAVHTAVDRSGTPRKIIHRDVSPANVLIDRSGVVKLGDFGIAHASSRITRTRPGAVKGKLRYMAPEQLVGQPVDSRADLYAIGIVLVEMLLGPDICEPKRMTPFGPVFTWSRQRGAQAGLPADLLDVLDKALADRPNDRYRDAAAFRRDLAAALHRRAPGYGAEDLARDLDLVTIERSPVAAITEPLEQQTDISPPRGNAHDQLDVSDSEPLHLEKPFERPPLDATVRARKVAPPSPPSRSPSVEILAEPQLIEGASFLDDQKPTMPFHSPMGPPPIPNQSTATAPIPFVPSSQTFDTASLPMPEGSSFTRLARELPWKKVGLVAGGASAAVIAITVAVTLAMGGSSAPAMPRPIVQAPVMRPPPTSKPLTTGKLQVEGPAGTGVMIGSTTYPPAPIDIELPAGQYEVKLVRHGRRARTIVRQVVIEPGREVALRL